MDADVPEEPELLCVVEDLMSITGRGTVIFPGDWRTGQIRRGDWIELRSVDGGSHTVRVSAFEMTTFAPGQEPVVKAGGRAALLLGHIDRADIHKGDEVWSVVNPPASPEPATPVPSPKRSWWQRLADALGVLVERKR